jgi:hypothetical protein
MLRRYAQENKLTPSILKKQFFAYLTAVYNQSIKHQIRINEPEHPFAIP